MLPVTALRLVVMGVSGCGKSTLALALAARLGLRMVDGDDLHGTASVAKMAAGVPLDDADRWPWLDRVGACLAQSAAHNIADNIADTNANSADTAAQATPEATGCVVACSALKRSYRDRIRQRASGVRFVYLHGSAALIRARLEARTDHYMPPDLLDSQLRTLEVPGPDEVDVIAVSVNQPVSAMLDWIISSLNRST